MDMKKAYAFTAILCFIMAILMAPSEVLAALQNPEQKEIDLVKKLRDRYNPNNAPVIDPTKDPPERYGIKEIKDSLGDDLKGKNVKIKEKECKHDKYDKCEIYVKTRLVKYDPKEWPKAKEGGYLGPDGEPTIKIENRVKKLHITYALMISHALLAGVEEPTPNPVGQCNSDRLFYHEMLHGQIKVNEMKDPNWKGWELLCKCTPLTSNLLDVGDPDHKEIPGLESTYLDNVAHSRGYVLYPVDRKTHADRKGSFKIVIDLPEDIQKKYQEKGLSIDHYEIFCTVNDNDINLSEENKKLVIEGTLDPDASWGRVHITIDPYNVGMIISVGISRIIAAPVGGTAVPVSKLGLLAPWIVLATLIIPAVSVMIWKRRRRATKA